MSDDPRDLSHQYNTQLKPEEEANFLQWAKKNGRLGDVYDYDLRGAFRKGLTADPRGHLPDTFKKPNHPTFSDQSQYNGVDGMFGGSWSRQGEQDAFAPGPANLHWRPLENLQNYFRDREPNGVLLPPIVRR